MDAVVSYLHDNFLTDLKEFMSTHVSQFPDGIKDPDAIASFISFLKEKYSQSIKNSENTTGFSSLPPSQQPPIPPINYNPPLSPNQQPPSTFVQTTETPPSQQPTPENLLRQQKQ